MVDRQKIQRDFTHAKNYFITFVFDKIVSLFKWKNGNVTFFTKWITWKISNRNMNQYCTSLNMNELIEKPVDSWK